MDESCLKVESTVKNSWKEFRWPECLVNAYIPAQRQCVTGLSHMVDGTVLRLRGAQYLTCTVLSKLKQLMLYAKGTEERTQFDMYE